MIAPHNCFTMYQIISSHITCHSRQIIFCEQWSGTTRADCLELVRFILMATNAACKVTEIAKTSIHTHSIAYLLRKGFWACLSDLSKKSLLRRSQESSLLLMFLRMLAAML